VASALKDVDYIQNDSPVVFGSD